MINEFGMDGSKNAIEVALHVKTNFTFFKLHLSLFWSHCQAPE